MAAYDSAAARTSFLAALQARAPPPAQAARLSWLGFVEKEQLWQLWELVQVRRVSGGLRHPGNCARTVPRAALSVLQPAAAVLPSDSSGPPAREARCDLLCLAGTTAASPHADRVRARTPRLARSVTAASTA